MTQTHLCILSFSTIANDSRVLRAIEYAGREYRVDVIGYGEWSPPWQNVVFHRVQLPQRRKARRLISDLILLGGKIKPGLWEKAYWRERQHRDALDLLVAERYALVHANDLMALPVAIEAAKRIGAKVVFDAHEYSPGQAMYSSIRNKLIYHGYVEHLLRHFAHRADKCVTVCDGIAALYREKFGLEAEVIMNAASRNGSEFRPVDPDQVKLIHHGAAKPARRLEKMIELVRALDERYSLYFMLIGQGRYLKELKTLAAETAPGRVFFKDPVPPDKVVSHLSQFDMSLCLIPPMPVSYKFALPNKFFESVAAGLAIVTGPSPEMARLTRMHGFGVVAPGFETGDFANVLNGLNNEKINDMKAKALAGAEMLSADVEMGKLLNIYRGLMGK